MHVERLERDAITRLAYLMLGLWGFLLYALGPALPELRRELGVSRAVVGLHTTIVALGAIGVGIAGDTLVARLGRRRAFWSSGVALVAGAGALALGRTIAITFTASLVLGLGGALAVTLVQATLADRHGALAAAAIVEANALAVAVGASAPLAVALAILLGGDWRAVFLAAALVPVPALALTHGSVAFPAPPALMHGHGPRLPAAYWLYWAALLLFVAIEFCIVFWSTDYLETVRRLSRSSAAASSSVFLVGMTLGRVAGGWLATRIRSERLLAGALAIAGAGFLGFWLLDVPPLTVVSLGVTGTGVSLLYPLTLALAIESSGGRTDAASARASFASGTAIAAAPFTLGALADRAGLREAYAIVAVLVAAAACILFAARRAQSR